MDLGSVNTLFSLISFGWQSDFLNCILFTQEGKTLVFIFGILCAQPKQGICKENNRNNLILVSCSARAVLHRICSQKLAISYRVDCSS